MEGVRLEGSILDIADSRTMSVGKQGVDGRIGKYWQRHQSRALGGQGDLLSEAAMRIGNVQSDMGLEGIVPSMMRSVGDDIRGLGWSDRRI